MSKPWWIAALMWFVITFIASSQASVLPPQLFLWQDKCEHALWFTVGGLCVLHALRRTSPPRSPIMITVLTILFCVVVGVFDEWHQTFTPGRYGNDLGDMLADATGGLIAAVIGLRWK
jgi:VanZ family protein